MKRLGFVERLQLMRYAAGAGLEVNFHPFKGNLHDERDQDWIKRVKRGVKAGEFSIKANAKASFAIAEGRVRTEFYLPHFAGFHVTPNIGGQQFELGYIRIYADVILSGGAGASLAVEADIVLGYEGGKQGLRGVPPQNRNRASVKMRSGNTAECKAFAGGRLNIDLQAELQWLNPEGPDAQAPGKVKPGEAIAEYRTFALIGYGAAVSAGVGVTAAFKISIESGKFIVHAKLGACVGVGAEGAVKCEVTSSTITEFFKFTAYQLKRADYHKLSDFMTQEAHLIYSYLYYLIIAKGVDLKNYANIEKQKIIDEFNYFKSNLDHAIKNDLPSVEKFIQRMKEQLQEKSGSWFTYAPPETIGQLQRQISMIGMSSNYNYSQEPPRLLALALGAPQTTNQLLTIAERMTYTMGDKQDFSIGIAMINRCLSGSAYQNDLQVAMRRLESVKIMNSKPFIWNNESEFIAAKIGIEDAMYA